MHTNDAVGPFLVSRRAQGCTGKTIEGYEWALAYLPDPLPARPGELEEVLAGVDLAIESRIDLHRVWRTFYAWAHDRLDVPNPMASVRRPRRQPKFPRVFSQRELQIIWAACVTPRDRAMVAVFLDTGVRLGELAGLTWSDVGRGILTLRGKVGSRTVPISRDTQQLLVGLGDAEHLWTGPAGPLGREGVKTAVRRLLRRAGIRPPKAGPHTFRHTCGTELYRASRDIHYVQRILGHRQLTSTLIYVHMVDEDLVARHEEHTVLRLVYSADDTQEAAK